MAEQTNRPVGRPPVAPEGSEFLGVRVAKSIAQQIREVADRDNKTQAEATRELLAAGLAAVS